MSPLFLLLLKRAADAPSRRFRNVACAAKRGTVGDVPLGREKVVTLL
jgi:hypothetical protein